MDKHVDRRSLIQLLDRAPGAQAQLIAVATPDTPKEFREIRVRWFEHVVRSCLLGARPSFDAFSDLTITPETPTNDLRRRFLDFALKSLDDMPVVSVHHAFPQQPSALQLIVDEDVTYIAANELVEGKFWLWIDGASHLVAGCEVEDRLHRSHITVLFGTIGRVEGAMVFWQGTPSLIRAASDERLSQLLGNSIGVPQTTSRWQGFAKSVDPAVIRSTLFEVEMEGVHPSRQGTAIVDRIERDERAGMPSRRSSIQVVPLVGETYLEEPHWDDHFDDAELLETISGSLDPDEKALFEALYQDPGQPMSHYATEYGWDLTAVQATMKRTTAKTLRT